ncbi:hypothetical protein Tco_0486956 [Tanacetum coccineum]
MYGKAAQLQKQMDAKSAWFQEKYFGRTHGGIGCSSSQTDFPLTEKELHQLRMDEEALKEMLEKEAMNKKAQEKKIRQEQAENNAFFLEFRVVRYDSDCVVGGRGWVGWEWVGGGVDEGDEVNVGVGWKGGRRLPVPRCNTRAHCATHHCGDWRGSFLEEVAFVRSPS